MGTEKIINKLFFFFNRTCVNRTCFNRTYNSSDVIGSIALKIIKPVIELRIKLSILLVLCYPLIIISQSIFPHYINHYLLQKHIWNFLILPSILFSMVLLLSSHYYPSSLFPHYLHHYLLTISLTIYLLLSSHHYKPKSLLIKMFFTSLPLINIFYTCTYEISCF
jgi:hypothetical protein